VQLYSEEYFALDAKQGRIQVIRPWDDEMDYYMSLPSTIRTTTESAVMTKDGIVSFRFEDDYMSEGYNIEYYYGFMARRSFSTMVA
jgi:hypothetical protein